MRANALLQRLPHLSDTEPRPRGAGRRGRKHAAAAHTANAVPVSQPDRALARVRNAGGPIDNASYTCACGFVFAASVSTTVSCPHCGADQAW